MRYNDARRWGSATSNDVLKFRKIIEFESLCIVIYFSNIYLIVDEKGHLSITKIVKSESKKLIKD